MGNTVPIINKVDEHGKKIVWESPNEEYFISINSFSNPSYLALWHNNKKVGEFNVSIVTKGGRKWYKVGMIEIQPKHRGKGLGKMMYKVLISLKNDVSGIYSYLPDRVNRKTVPAIYKSLGGKVVDGDHSFIQKLEEIHVMNFKQFINEKSNEYVYKISREEADYFTNNNATNLITRISDPDDDGTVGWYMKATSNIMNKVTDYDSGEKNYRYSQDVMDKVAEIYKRPKLELTSTIVNGKPQYRVVD